MGLGRYGYYADAAAASVRLPFSRHWWAGFKPFMELTQRTPSYAPTHDLQQLAKFYDYAVHENEPPLPSWRADRDREAHAARDSELPQCVVAQRAARRAIERHPHFDEIVAIWQADQWQGHGYPAWPRLPGEPIVG
jgi:hypothetical protein